MPKVSHKNFESAEIRTRGGWMRGTNASSVLFLSRKSTKKNENYDAWQEMLCLVKGQIEKSNLVVVRFYLQQTVTNVVKGF